MLWTEYISPQILLSKDKFRWSHEDESLMMKLVPLKEETPENLFSNHAQLGKAMGGYSKNWQTMKWVSPEPDHTITLILDFQFFQDCEKIRVYCLSQVYGILLRQPSLTKTEGQIYSHSLDSCSQILITGDLATHPVR